MDDSERKSGDRPVRNLVLHTCNWRFDGIGTLLVCQFHNEA